MVGMPATQLWSVRTGRERLDSQTRASLISAAKLAFSQLGYARTTVADITERAEVSRATFYVYFASKDKVFRVLTERLRDAFLEAQQAQIMGHLVRLYLQALGIGQGPGREATS
jgi:AcrR family transcriptional regulator